MFKQREKKRKSSYRYTYDTQINLRIGAYEKSMLEYMMKRWNVSLSETVRRAIVYTFSKFVVRGMGLSDDDLREAIDIAIRGLKKKV